jgi:hypothetical protein
LSEIRVMAIITPEKISKVLVIHVRTVFLVASNSLALLCQTA